jgi:type IX secretion system PorP/SprF family membrane protein
MKKISLFILACGLSCFSIGQDALFSNPRSSQLNVNPAFAGTWACARAQSAYRLQWPMLSGSYRTLDVSYDQYFNRAGGAGFKYQHDDAGGVIKRDRFDFIYAPRIGLLKDSAGKARLIIQPAVQIGYYQLSADWNKLSFGDMIDPRSGFVYNTNEVPNTAKRANLDLAAGIVVFTNRICAGFAIYHLTEPDEGFIGPSKLPMRFMYHASGIFGDVSDEKALHIIPAFIFARQQSFTNTVFHVTGTYRGAEAGMGIRLNDALIFSAGYNIGRFRFGYTYDMTISALAGGTGGSHEIHFSCRFWDKTWRDQRTNLSLYN